MAIAAFTAVVLLVGCGGNDNKTTKGTATTAASADGDKETPASQGTAPAGATLVGIKVGETDVNHQYLTPDSTSAPAGAISFEIVNEGQKKHEFIVMKTDTMAADLEFDAEADRIVEKDDEVVDEAEEIDPGSTATLNLDLDAAHYVLVCNIKGHYRMGMVSDFTVG